MKCLLVTLLTFTPLFLKAQEITLPKNDAGNIEYTEIVKADSATEQQLFSRSKLFVANAFTSATDVTKLEDATTFTVITKGNLPRYYSNPFNRSQGGYVTFKFTVQCRPGRYKYSVTNLAHNSFPSSNINDSGGDLANETPICSKMYLPMKHWRRIKEQTDRDIKLFIVELKRTMAGDKEFSGRDNW